MQLYTSKDLSLIDDKIEDIIKKIENKKLEIFEPTKKELVQINNIILEFIKNKKRKIYGGTAQNMLIIAKNPSDAIYDENQIADIDFYSPEPINDLIELCNALYKKNFKYI